MNKYIVIDIFFGNEDVTSIQPFGSDSVCFNTLDGDKIHIEVNVLKRGLAVVEKDKELRGVKED